MHRKRIRIGLLAFAILVPIAIGVFGAFMRPALEPDRVIAARFGNVVWNHELHARMEDIPSCQVCHHTERAGNMEPRACRECHHELTNEDALVVASLHMDVEPTKYEGENGPPPMTAFHASCVGCHVAMAEGPVGCRDCHAQEFTGAHGVVRWDHFAHSRRIDMGGPGGVGEDCEQCHHHDELATNDGEYRSCSVCHEPAAVLGLEVATGIKSHEPLKHGDCDRCHTVRNPENDRRTCKHCHGKWDIVPEGLEAAAFDDPATPRPTLEQAVHQRCGECHREDWNRFADGMPARCEDCHEPDRSLLGDLDVGIVLWDHDRHAKYGEGMTCTKCHHTDAIEQPHMACSRCHGTGLYDNPTVAEALRKRCLGCHEEKGNGLLAWDQIVTDREDLDHYRYEGADGSFWWDHREHAVAWSFSCRNCHHGTLRENGEYVTAAKAEAAWTGEATKIQSCRNCHGDEGPVAGSPAEGSKAPKFGDAYRTICLECHRRLGGGPQDWNDYFTLEPLTDSPEPSGEL